MITRTTLNNFYNDVLNQTKPVLAVFCASSCQLCDIVEPVLEGFASEFAGRVHFVRVDMDETQELRALYEINVRPTMVLFDDGWEVTRFTGPPNGVAIRDVLTKVAGPIESQDGGDLVKRLRQDVL